MRSLLKERVNNVNYDLKYENLMRSGIEIIWNSVRHWIDSIKEMLFKE